MLTYWMLTKASMSHNNLYRTIAIRRQSFWSSHAWQMMGHELDEQKELYNSAHLDISSELITERFKSALDMGDRADRSEGEEAFDLSVSH